MTTICNAIAGCCVSFSSGYVLGSLIYLIA